MAEKRCPSCLREYDGEGCSCGYPEKGQNASHQLPVGTVLRGRYMIGKALGQGGFGITYLAWDKLMQTSVAVKEFYPGGTVFRKSATSLAVECGTEEIIPHYEYSKERFLREAGALVKFKDIPEIVDILDFAEENNTAYIVMEYVRGMDLAKYINMKGGKLSPEETFRILRPVMEALAKVHKGGIVHRDISPDNIILDPMGGAKLLDFGAVRAVEDPDVDKGLNKSTEAILKQGFAPIEQYNTRGNLGPWTDEYAVCATVWYCLTGTVPAEASIRVSEGIDPDWAGIPGLPEHQQKALEKGIACRAKDRYRSLDELLEALFPEEQPLPIAEEPFVPVPPPYPDKIVDRRPKRRWIGAVVAAILILAIALSAFLFMAPKAVPEETVPPQLQEPMGQTQPTVEQIPPITGDTEPTTEPLSEEERRYLQAEQLLAEGKLGEAAIAFGKLAGYSDARERSFEIWAKIAVRETIGAGAYHTVGLKDDGTVVAVGNKTYDQCDVNGWTDIVAVSAAGNITVGLRADGTVIAVGWTDDVSGWTDIVAVSTGSYHIVGLKTDGTVVAVGDNTDGECRVEDWTDIVAISAGYQHTVGLKADGTLVAVDNNEYGQCDVSGWTDIAAVSAGSSHTVGLKLDGTVVAVGDDSSNQCDVSDWTDTVAVSAGTFHTVGLRADGTVVTAGANYSSVCNVSGWADIVAVDTYRDHTVGLRADGMAVAVGYNAYGQCNVTGWPMTDILLPKERLPFR